MAAPNSVRVPPNAVLLTAYLIGGVNISFWFADVTQ